MRNLLLTLLIIITALAILTSNSSGITRQHDATGSPLATIACGSCHNGGNFGTQTTVQLLDANGMAQSSYTPGQTYRIQISASTTSAPAAYGYQAVILDDNEQQAGTFGTPSSNLRVSDRGGIEYVDHRQRINDNSITIEWTAPPVNTGEVSVFAVVNAVNGNGGTNGDQPDEGVLTLPEAVSPPTFVPTSLADLRPVDASTGVAARLGDRVEVEALVFGFDIEDNVSNFNLIDTDNTAGIAVISDSKISGYNASNGDRVRVRGTVRQAAGTTFIEPADIMLLMSGAALPAPLRVTELDESVEGQLVTLTDLTLVDSMAWMSGATATFDFPVRTAGGETVIIQVAVGMPVHGGTLPGDARGTYEITGVVRQADATTPLFEEYYLLPRFTSDFSSDLSSTNEVKRASFNVVRRGDVIEVSAQHIIASVQVLSLEGRVIYSSKSFSNSTFVKTDFISMPNIVPVVVFVRLQNGQSGAVLVRGER